MKLSTTVVTSWPPSCNDVWGIREVRGGGRGWLVDVMG